MFLDKKEWEKGNETGNHSKMSKANVIMSDNYPEKS